jgi:hypothetical protein
MNAQLQRLIIQRQRLGSKRQARTITAPIYCIESERMTMLTEAERLATFDQSERCRDGKRAGYRTNSG